MRLTLNNVDVAVLLRCLSYGENAISETERKDGTANVIVESITRVRRQLSKNISSQVISAAVENKP